MDERVHYSSLKFKKNLRRETAASQGEDVTYSEVKVIHPTSSKAVCQSHLTEKSVGSSHPYRLAAACLGLLCALLLAATLVLCIFYTRLSQTCSLSERHLEDLRASNSTMKQERDQLQRNYTRLNTERDQLQRNYTILKQERDQQQRDFNVTFKKVLSMEQLCLYSSEKRECKPCPQGWELFGSKFYYFSTESKSWTESRSDCIKWGADLVIIETEEEQDFISSKLQYNHWIGLNETDTEGTWLWVDGSPLQRGFWGSGEPDDKPWKNLKMENQNADCAVTEKTWMDQLCVSKFRFICETDALLL